MFINYEEKFTTEVTMRPVCECGYVFKELSYNKLGNVFYPKICPNCNRNIERFTFYDLSKYVPDKDGVIKLTE